MQKTINIQLTNEEIVEALFNKDQSEIAEIFSLWKKRFDKNKEERTRTGKPIWIFDLNHFFMYVAEHLDEDGKDFFRTAFATIWYKEIDQITARHIMYLSK